MERAREFLANIEESGQLFNYSTIINIARMAQRISQDTLDEVSKARFTLLAGNTNYF